jgi:predicted enzyme related to lactoylglutathione lyase
MSEVQVTPGRFAWHELNSQEPEKSLAFYAELFGWKFDSQNPTCVKIMLHDVAIGGVVKAPLSSVPTFWLPYVAVDDVEASTERATLAGCTALGGPMNVDPGWLTVLRDPLGALFAVVHPKRPAAPVVARPMPGGFCWDQLSTPDQDASAALYAQLFGWTRSDMPGTSQGSILACDVQPTASLMDAASDARAHWLCYVAVDDLSAACARAVRLGGRVIAPHIEMPGVGACSILEDNLGALIAACEPA